MIEGGSGRCWASHEEELESPVGIAKVKRLLGTILESRMRVKPY
jgi:hypothetical protein